MTLVSVSYVNGDVRLRSGEPIVLPCSVPFALADDPTRAPRDCDHWVIATAYHLRAWWDVNSPPQSPWWERELWLYVDGEPVLVCEWTRQELEQRVFRLPSMRTVVEGLRLKLLRDRVNDIDRRVCTCRHYRGWHRGSDFFSGGCAFPACKCMAFHFYREATV